MEQQTSDRSERQAVGLPLRDRVTILAGAWLVSLSAVESFHSDAVAIAEGIGVLLVGTYLARRDQAES